MRYFLGVDGGGTKTIAVVVDEKGKKGEGISGALDIFNENESEFRRNFFKAVESALKEAKVSPYDISYACFGIPAVGDVEGVEEKVISITDKLGIESIVVNDVRVALEGAFPMKDGMIVLSGTGAMVMGKKRNEIFRVDGWGEHAGDLGSGYFIGKLTLQRVFKEYDGREKRSLLIERVKEFTEVQDVREILLKCKGTNVRKYIASFAKVTCLSAEEGIEPACEILKEAAGELIKSVETASKLMETKNVELALVGGVFKCDYFRDTFEDLIKSRHFRIVEGEFAPHLGAVMMAAKKVLDEKEIKDLYDKLKRSGGSR